MLSTPSIIAFAAVLLAPLAVAADDFTLTIWGEHDPSFANQVVTNSKSTPLLLSYESVHEAPRLFTQAVEEHVLTHS